MVKLEIKEQLAIYNLLLNAMNSDNADYIKEQLDKIYTIICNSNI